MRAFLSVLVLAALLGPRPAHAWGKLGHDVVTRLAERRLRPATAAALRDLLEPGESLVDAASWPDLHADEVPGSGPWHYVDVPLDEPRYDARFCGRAGCIVAKIEELRAVVARADAPPAERRRALRFLIHLVEDLHQPLHVGDRHDRGGNDEHVLFFGEPTTLHRVWDQALLERHSTSERRWLAELEPLAAASPSCDGSVEDWANESLAAARDAYAGPRLGRAYLRRELPVARRRLALAAVRLACVLDAALAR